MKVNNTLVCIVILSVIIQIGAPPVKEQKTEDGKDQNEVKDELEDYMEYSRYLKEVVNALESDPEFRKKLEKAEEADIRSGKIANELEFVAHNVRTRLDEIKRNEIERLRHLASMKNHMENGLEPNHMKLGVNKEHLDHGNPHTFEIEDLKKLIAKTAEDLAEADRKRRQEFKEYEMQKEFEKQEKLKSLDDVHRLEMEKQYEEQKKKHKKHEPLHHPGSKQQLEEVWEKQDHMEKEDFNPKTFFMLHDLDGNGYWDENEVKALFLKELDKLYQSGVPEDDMRERAEEMERMREHVFSEADLNRDGLISFQEFSDQTRKPEFQRDQGWEGLDQQQLYTPEEYQEFERQRVQEIERLIALGKLPPHPAGYPQYQHPQQHHAPVPPGGYHQQPVQYHPGQAPQAQGHPQQYNNMPVYQHGAPQYQQHPQQGVPQYQHGNQQYQQPPVMQQGGVPQYQNQQQYVQHPNQNINNGQRHLPQQNIQQPNVQQPNIQHQNIPQQPNVQHQNVPQQQQQPNIQQQQPNIAQQQSNVVHQANGVQQPNIQQTNNVQQQNVPQQANAQVPPEGSPQQNNPPQNVPIQQQPPQNQNAVPVESDQNKNSMQNQHTNEIVKNDIPQNPSVNKI